MSDDRPPAPAYRPPITIPSGEFLGRIAYHAWFEADLSRPAVDWTELSEAERDTWRRVAQQIRVATERSHALGNYLPPPSCPAKRQDRYTYTSAVAGTRTRLTTALMTKATAGCRSSREVTAAAPATVL
jgi:hypothetical protein